MQRHASRIDGSNARRRGYNHPFRIFGLELMQECGFACTRFAREKNIPAGIAYVVECQIELGVSDEVHAR